MPFTEANGYLAERSYAPLVPELVEQLVFDRSASVII
jgi:hypothetical protein